MSHLLAISVGPVQEFIAAARRTRDLWFGSYLLSEISKAVAKSVRDQIKPHGGKLIFPSDDMDLSPGDETVNVANIILAELPPGDPKQVASNAKKAAENRWIDFVNDVWNQASGVIRTDKDFWNEQKDDVIEFYAAWLTYDPSKYREGRKDVMRLLAGRKSLRNFQSAKGNDAGIPKSSLDGQRESVLKDPRHWPDRFRARLRIREGEQLDVVGLVKRTAEGNRPYPSVSRIAADPWVRGNHGNPTLLELKKVCQELPQNVLHRLDEGVFSQFKDFPFEGTAVYISRHHEWKREIDEEDRSSIDNLQKTLNKLPEPNPYLAVLVADGDGMGAVISALASADENREFSRTLAGFADSARSIVYQHKGVLVYAGGDDVLAFLPVDKCLSCARHLHDKFGDALTHYKKDDGESPTLSVGIAIGHFMENLEDLLEYGRAAEKAAKKVQGKDALAVHLHKRGGAPIKIARCWKHSPDEDLTRFAEWIQKGALPSRLPYDLHKLAEVYETTNWSEQERLQAMRQDVLRVIADKQPRSGKACMKQIREVVLNLGSVTELKLFCDELLVARLLSEVFDQARRQPKQLAPQKEGAA